MGKMQVFVVDDEPLVRKGLKLLLTRRPDLEVCGDTGSGSEAFEQILSLRPDLAIVDLNLKEGDGLKLMRQLRQQFPTLRMLVFSMHEEVSYVQAALRAGANGYVTKSEGPGRIIEAIELLLKNNVQWPARIAARCPLIGLDEKRATHLTNCQRRAARKAVVSGFCVCCPLARRGDCSYRVTSLA